MANELLSMDAERMPSKWKHFLGRKRSLEVNKVTKKELDNLDVNMDMTTTDTEISYMLNDEIKIHYPAQKKTTLDIN